MLKRTITGVVLASLAIPVCVFSDHSVLQIVVALLSFGGTFEMLNCIGMKKKWFVSVPLLIVSAVLPLLVRVVNNRNIFLALFFSISFIMLLYLLAVHVFYMRKVTISDVSTAYVTTIYIIIGFSSIILLRDEPLGVFYFLVPVIAPLLCDIFAYFTGRLFGKTKLIPSISPNKTVEGSIGGTLICTLACTGYGLILRHVLPVSSVIPAWSFAIAGFIIALISQVGDLIASSIKRNYGVKDYGRIFPGHGGILDRLDSVIPTTPIFLVILVVVTNFMK